MTSALKIALATINPTLGDIDGNAARILEARAQASGADIIVYSELVLIGYPPEDLVLKPAFQRDVMDKAVELATVTNDGGSAMLIGSCWVEGGKLYNSSLLLDKGTIAAIRHKRDLPNYGVFDEKRVFSRGECPEPMEFRGVKLGVLTCEDLWWEEVTQHLADKHSDILVSLNGSPYEEIKYRDRFQNARERVAQAGLSLIYTNQFGGQDELVFDGEAFVMDRHGEIIMRQTAFQEQLTITDWAKEGDHWVCSADDVAPKNDRMTDIYLAAMIGVRDYVNKNHFPGVIIGMSGGIDSALSAIIAVDALGADKVHLVMMPSKYTSEESLMDAADAARMMGCGIDNISINDAVKAFDGILSGAFAGTDEDVTEENLQSRIRAVILMALSNKHGKMVLTTGNKSEMSVGYATLYIAEYKRRQAPPGVKITTKNFGRDRRYPITNGYRDKQDN